MGNIPLGIDDFSVDKTEIVPFFESDKGAASPSPMCFAEKSLEDQDSCK